MKTDRELTKFGRAIREVRMARNLSQEAFAEISGLHRNYIGGIERGERNVGIKTLFRMAKALGLHPADLLARCEYDWIRPRRG